MSFTDQKPRIATMKDLQTKWCGDKPGKKFRCYLCGHRFQLGDYWRWVYSNGRGCINIIVCHACDRNDPIRKFINDDKLVKEKYWAHLLEEP